MKEAKRIVELLSKEKEIIGCGMIDKFGNVIECCAPESLPKDKLSKVYALEVGMLENLKELFGEFSYRISKFGNSSQIIYKHDDLYLVASSTCEPKELLEIVKRIIEKSKE